MKSIKILLIVFLALVLTAGIINAGPSNPVTPTQNSKIIVAQPSVVNC